MGHEHRSSEWKSVVPTYNANAFADEIAAGKMQEFGAPYVPVAIRRDEGVRVVLGTTDPHDTSKPDIQIERRPNGWAIFLHPVGGGDPSGCVYFVDDGRSIVSPESEFGTTPAIIIRRWDDPVDEVDLQEDPALRWLTDDDLINGLSTEIASMREAIKGIRESSSRLKLLHIALRLKAIHEAM